METTIFGFKINPGRRRVAYTDALARLFLCDCVDFDYVRDQVSKLVKGDIGVDDINMLTDAWGIYKADSYKSQSTFLNNSRTKFTDWFAKAGIPSERDFDYLKKKFGIDTTAIRTMANDVRQNHISSARCLAKQVKRYIKGQDEAIDRMAVNFFLHLESVRTGKSNRIKTPVLLMGPTGVGKSEIYRRFGQLCNCPIIRINSSEIVPTSWRGTHISDILVRNISDSSDVDRLRHAIIVFHEFDKITAYNQNKVGTASSDIVDARHNAPVRDRPFAQTRKPVYPEHLRAACRRPYDCLRRSFLRHREDNSQTSGHQSRRRLHHKGRQKRRHCVADAARHSRRPYKMGIYARTYRTYRQYMRSQSSDTRRHLQYHDRGRRQRAVGTYRLLPQP